MDKTQCIVYACLEAVEGSPLTRLALQEAGNLFRGHQITHMKLNQEYPTKFIKLIKNFGTPIIPTLFQATQHARIQ
jgi:hypothetical protein